MFIQSIVRPATPIMLIKMTRYFLLGLCLVSMTISAEQSHAATGGQSGDRAVLEEMKRMRAMLMEQQTEMREQQEQMTVQKEMMIQQQAQIKEQGTKIAQLEGAVTQEQQSRTQAQEAMKTMQEGKDVITDECKQVLP